jgi:type I restriction enzyme M protein
VRGKQQVIVEYEPDPDLRDTEQIPFLEAPLSGNPGGLPSDVPAVASAEAGATAKAGIETFIRREVLPYTPDAWIKEDATRIGYEISFTRHFYQPQPLRTLDEIRADILAVEKEAEGLLDVLLKGGAK